MTSSTPLQRRRIGRNRLFVFLATPPLRDVEWLIGLLPVWWFLGIEQWIPVVILGWAFVKLAVQRRRIARRRTTIWLALLVAAMVVSGLFIVENERYVTFLRNLSVHAIAPLLFVVVTTEVRTWAQVRRLLIAVAIAMAGAGAIGAIGFLGLADLRFPSPFGYLLPGWIRATEYGGTIAYRSIGGDAWFSGLGRYFRTDSVFMFSTMYASALAISIPLVMFMAERNRGAVRLVWSVLVALLGTNLVFTTGRVATIALLAGAAYFVLLRLGPIALAALTCSGIGFLAVAAMVLPAGTATQVGETVILARGDGSLNSRLLIYRKTLEGVLERPVFGWGTERDIQDVKGFKYPAGSHSFYLATLYRHGLVGLILLGGVLLSLWRDARPWKTSGRVAGDLADARLYLVYGRWILVVFLVNGLTTVPDVDASLYLIAWTCFATLAATRRLGSERDLGSSAPGSEVAWR